MVKSKSTSRVIKYDGMLSQLELNQRKLIPLGKGLREFTQSHHSFSIYFHIFLEIKEILKLAMYINVMIPLFFFGMSPFIFVGVLCSRSVNCFFSTSCFLSGITQRRKFT